MASSGQAGGLGTISTEDSKPVSLVDWQIPDNTAGCYVACVSAMEMKGGLAKFWQFSFGAKSFNGALAVVGVPKQLDADGDVGTEDWGVTVTSVDDVFKLMVTGVDGLPINWAGYVDSVLVGS